LDEKRRRLKDLCQGLILLYHSKWGSKMIISDLVIFQLLPLFWDSLLTYNNQQKTSSVM
jgi:hypothetical protein